MGMGQHKKHLTKTGGIRQRILAAVLICSLLLTNMNFGSILSYATQETPEIFDIGADVTAELEDGVLTIKGYGDTEDYTEDTAPFLGYSDEIHTLVIEDGITHIGSYLFYGLGGLRGKLILPGSIDGVGDYAFSGEAEENAPGLTVIVNEFEGGEIAEWEDRDENIKEGQAETKENRIERDEGGEETEEGQAETKESREGKEEGWSGIKEQEGTEEGQAETKESQE